MASILIAYLATELECLAIKDSVHHFEIYLHGRKCTVRTDHRALESMLKSNHLNMKLKHWAVYLQQLNMEFNIDQE